MQCLEFRRLCRADPRCSDPAYLEHAERCRACAGYLQRLLHLDALILEALHLDVRPPGHVEVWRSDQSSRRLAAGRWLGIAASLLAAFGIGAGIWLSPPGNTLASDVVAHIPDRPRAAAISRYATAPAPSGFSLEAQARSCRSLQRGA